MPRYPRLKREDIQIGEIYKYTQYPYYVVMVRSIARDTVWYEYLSKHDGPSDNVYPGIMASFLAYYRKAY